MKKWSSKIELHFCCLGEIRTPTGGTRIRRATITPQGNLFCALLLGRSPFAFALQSYGDFLICANFLMIFFEKKLHQVRMCHIFRLLKTLKIYFWNRS